MIKVKDLIVGKVYLQEVDVEDNFIPGRYISRFSGIGKGLDNCIDLKENEYFTKGFTDGDGQVKNLREADAFEILWLEACEKADGFVSKEEVLDNIKLSKAKHNKLTKLIDSFNEI